MDTQENLEMQANAVLKQVREWYMTGEGSPMEDALDVEYVIGFNHNYRGAILTMVARGPHIEIDTREGAVRGWTEGYHTSIGLTPELVDALDQEAKDFFEDW